MRGFIFPLLVVVALTVNLQQASAQYPKPGIERSSQAGSPSGKLRSCQVRENAIKKRMDRLLKLATNMQNKFDRHAQKVQNYYTSKVIPKGKTVSGYDALVTDIQAKKAAVETALNKVQNDANSFSCTSSSPKAQMTQFRQDMQAVKKALKGYRASVKNLIVAVRSVTGSENRSSPKPSESPKGGKSKS